MASKNRSVVITVIAVAVIVILCVTYSSVELHLTNGFGDRDRNEGGQSGGASRLDRYCNIEIPNRQLLNHSLKENWTLQYLAINIRHGDRSAIHRMPGTTTFIDSSLPSQTPLDNKTTIYIEKLKAFHLSALPGSRKRYNFEKVTNDQCTEYSLQLFIPGIWYYLTLAILFRTKKRT